MLVVNWWATWPADRVNGQIVTDRALLKLEKGGRADRETHPDDLLERLRGLAAADAPPDRARRIDSFAAAVARKLHHSAPVADLEALYLPGLDIVAIQQLGDAAAAADVASLAARMDAVRGHHRFIDELLGGLRADMPANGVLLVVGDPGRLARQSGTVEGLIALSGANIVAGSMAPGGERDIAPTVLHLLGMPVSNELEGSVLEAALSPAFRAAHPVRRVHPRLRRRDGSGRARSTARCSRSCAASGIYGRNTSIFYVVSSFSYVLFPIGGAVVEALEAEILERGGLGEQAAGPSRRASPPLAGRPLTAGPSRGRVPRPPGPN